MDTQYDDINALMISFRRQLHMMPEIALKEYQTAEYILSILEKEGFTEIYKGLAGTGIVAVIRGQLNESILIRADIDGLPITEATNLPFASRNEGMMHACGHDGHTAILLGAAVHTIRMVKQGAKLNRGIKFCFQPGEENSDGAGVMLEDKQIYDILEAEPPVESCYALHINNKFPAGLVGYFTGPISAKSERWQIDIKTKSGGHCMAPEDSVDAIQIAIQLCNAILQVRGRNVSQVEPCTVSIGSLHSGSVPNIINDTAVIMGSVRTLKEENSVLIRKKLQSLCDGLQVQHDCTVTLDYYSGCRQTINDPILESWVHQKGIEAVGETMFSRNLVHSLGGEDFFEFAEKRPSAYLLIGGGDADRPHETFPNTHHSAVFDFDERCLIAGFKLWRAMIFDDGCSHRIQKQR